jgi:hypothetical protein
MNSEMAGVDDLINGYLVSYAAVALTATAIGAGLGWTAWRQLHRLDLARRLSCRIAASLILS